MADCKPEHTKTVRLFSPPKAKFSGRQLGTWNKSIRFPLLSNFATESIPGKHTKRLPSISIAIPSGLPGSRNLLSNFWLIDWVLGLFKLILINLFALLSETITSSPSKDIATPLGYAKSDTNGDEIGSTTPDCIDVQSILYGDVNFDGEINIVDVVQIVNFVLNVNIPSELEFQASDMNSDGIINVLDVIQLVNIILDN